MPESNSPSNLSRLEALPLEIRRAVYQQLGYRLLYPCKVSVRDRPITKTIAVKWEHTFLNESGDRIGTLFPRQQRPKDSRINPCPALMRVCKIISRDLYTILYSDSMFSFCFGISSTLLGFLTPVPFVLGRRALSYLTHVTLGPDYTQRNCSLGDGPFGFGRADLGIDPREPPFDQARVGNSVTSVSYICSSCPHLQVLRIYLWRLDIIPGPLERLEPLTIALGYAIDICPDLKCLTIGMGGNIWDSIDLEGAPNGKGESGLYVMKRVRSIWRAILKSSQSHG